MLGKFLIVVLLLWAAPADAAHLCVNPSTGNDSTAKASIDGSAQDGTGTCWATLNRAVYGSADRSTPSSGEAAAAGDTVWVAGGTYTTTGTGDRFLGAYDPVNAGSSGNPIVFRAVAPVYVTFSSGAGPVYSITTNYVEWVGPFHANGTTAPSTADTGPVFIGGAAVGAVIDGMFITGVGPREWNDNYTGIRLEYVAGATIRNTTITNIGTNAGTINEACIQAYRAGNVVIEHNHLSDCGTAVFLKGIAEEEYTGPWDIRLNWIEDSTNGVIVHRVGNSINPLILVYQNVIVRTDVALNMYNFGDATSVRNTHFVNNTIYETSERPFFLLYAFEVGVDADTSVKNNIFADSNGARVISHLGTGDTHFENHADIDFDRNLYYDYSGFAVAGEEVTNTTFTFAQWQASPRLQDLNALNGIDPDFVNAAGGDFRLATGSPALTLGRVVHSIGGTNGATIPAGAYITGDEIIGICPTDACESSEATVPDAPTIGTATAGNGQCSVSFTPPGNDGGATITGYTATSSPGSFTASGSASPLVVTGLTNGVGYTFTVVATNSEGNSAASAASNTCTPTAPPSGVPVRLRLRGGF